MIQDPAILANIITALLIALALVVFFLIATALLRWMADILVARATKRRRMAKSETHGDLGGWPTDAEWEKLCVEASAARPWDEHDDDTPAPEDGSGLLAKDNSQ